MNTKPLEVGCGGPGGRNPKQARLTLSNWCHRGDGTSTIVIATSREFRNEKQDIFLVTGAFSQGHAEVEIYDALIGDPYCPLTVEPEFDLFSFPESSLRSSMRYIVVQRGGPIYEGKCPHLEATITEGPPPKKIWYRCNACGKERGSRGYASHARGRRG